MTEPVHHSLPPSGPADGAAPGPDRNPGGLPQAGAASYDPPGYGSPAVHDTSAPYPQQVAPYRGKGDWNTEAAYAGSAPPPQAASPAAPPGCPAHEGEQPFRIGGLEFQRPPADLYRALRRQYGPVAPVLLDDDVPAWLALGYPEVTHVTAHDEIFARDSRRWNQWDAIPGNWPLLPYVGFQPSVLFTEGPEHRRRAGVISRALEAMDLYDVSLVCEAVGDRLIARFAGTGRAELMRSYVHSVPVRVIVELCGMPAGEEETEELVRDLRISLDAEEGEDPAAAYGRVGERIHALVKDRRLRPDRDITSYMTCDPAGLSDEEIVQDLVSVIAAGQQPTANWICNALRLLLLDDRFADRLAGGRVGVPEALNETLWLDTPTQNFIGRWAARDVELGGRLIRAGDCVVMGLSAANTDPEVWPEGYVGEENAANLSFSNGEHRCPHPAPQIARVIAQTAIDTLLGRLPDVAMAVEGEALRWRPSIWMRGLEELPVTFSPTVM